MIYTIENTSMLGKPVTVKVNGNIINNVFYADTDKGAVKYYPSPLKTKRPRRVEAYYRTLKGDVTVEPIEK